VRVQLLPLFMLVTLCFTVMCIDNKNLNERLGLTFTLLLASIGYTSQLRDHLPKCALAYPNIVNRPMHGHVKRWHGMAWHGMACTHCHRRPVWLAHAGGTAWHVRLVLVAVLPLAGVGI
jgi:hypothetical protein